MKIFKCLLSPLTDNIWNLGMLCFFSQWKSFTWQFILFCETLSWRDYFLYNQSTPKWKITVIFSSTTFYPQLCSSLTTIPPLCLVVAVFFPESLKVQTGKNPPASLRPSSPRGPVPTTHTRTEVKTLLRVMYPEKNNRWEWPKDWRKGKSSHLLHPSSPPHSPHHLFKDT